MNAATDANVAPAVGAGTVEDTLRPRVLSARPPVGAAGQATLILAGLTVAAAVLRFVRIGHQSFWYDESFTTLLVHHSPGEMFGLLPRTELTPPLYYSLAWIWARIFGYGEAGLRSLSALAGVATVPAIYGAGAKLISRRAGLVAAALVTCSPLLIWYSQEARSYAVLVLLCSLSLLAFAHARSPRPSPRWLGAWVLASSLTLATHYYGALAVAPEAVWLAWLHRRDRRVLLAVAAVAAVGLALLPLALSQRPQASWIAGWPLDRRLGQIPPQFVLGTGAPARVWLLLAGAIAVLIAVAMLALRAQSGERRAALLAGALALSGLVLSLVLLLLGVDELITRNVIVILPALILLIAGGLGGARAGALGLAGVAILCTIGLIATVAVASDPNLQRPPWRSLAQALGPRPPARAAGSARAGRAGRAILLERHIFLMPLGLYMPGLRFVGRRGTRVNELDVVAFDAPHGWFCWWGSACNLLPSVLDTSIRVRGFSRYGPVLHAGKFSVLRLRSAHTVRLTQGTIARALARAPLKGPPGQPGDLPPGSGAPSSYGLLTQPPA